MVGWAQGTLRVGKVSTALRGYVENVSELRLCRLKHESLLRCSPSNEAVAGKTILLRNYFKISCFILYHFILENVLVPIFRLYSVILI